MARTPWLMVACMALAVQQPAWSASDATIVFVHGGSNVSGYTADPVYDGGEFVNRNIANFDFAALNRVAGNEHA
ncbi:MAG TPA: hypothetical protein VJ598_11035 [Albitalea sp.]|nr:hypothetical protein [Albitalea sp.]